MEASAITVDYRCWRRPALAAGPGAASGAVRRRQLDRLAAGLVVPGHPAGVAHRRCATWRAQAASALGDAGRWIRPPAHADADVGLPARLLALAPGAASRLVLSTTDLRQAGRHLVRELDQAAAVAAVAHQQQKAVSPKRPSLHVAPARARRSRPAQTNSAWLTAALPCRFSSAYRLPMRHHHARPARRGLRPALAPEGHGPPSARSRCASACASPGRSWARAP